MEQENKQLKRRKALRIGSVTHRITETQKIALGICIGSLLSMLPIIFLYGNGLEVLCIIPITIISALIYGG